MIDIVWRTLIQEDEVYKEFWRELCSCYIERIESYSEDELNQKYMSYNNRAQLIDDIFMHYAPFYPETANEYNWKFLFELKYTIWINKKNLLEVTNKIENKLSNSEIDMLDSDSVNNLVKQIYQEILNEKLWRISENEEGKIFLIWFNRNKQVT